MGIESFEHETMIPGPASSANIIHEWTTEDGVMRCYGTAAYTVLEADTDTYAPGCTYIRSLTAGSSVVYVNVGTKAAPNFDVMTNTSSAESIDSDMYVDGSIDLAHMSANSVDSDQYVDGSIDNEHLAANSVDSDNYVDGSIDNEHLANDCVNSAECDESLIQTVTIVADADDLRAASSAPIELVAAPGAGKAIEYISCYGFLDYSGGALSAVSGSIKVGTMTQGSFASSFISATEDRVLLSHSGAENDNADEGTVFINTALTFALASDPTGAQSTSVLTLKVSYRILDFN